jgi:hypothetical protein
MDTIMIVFGFFICFGVLSGFFSRVTGIKMHTHTAFNRPSDSYLRNKSYKEQEENSKALSQIDPEIVEQAKINVKNSIYAYTLTNILIEANKLKKLKEEGPLIERIQKKGAKLLEHVTSKGLNKDDLTKLEKLYELKEKGVISNEEFETQKNKLLK